MQVLLVSEVEDIRNKGMLLTFWGLCGFYVDTNQTVPTGRISEKRRSEIEAELRKDFSGYRWRKVDTLKDANIVQINVPTRVKPSLPKGFVTSHNTPFYRYFIIHEGEKREVSDELIRIGHAKNMIDRQLALLREDISQIMNGRSQSTITQTANDLNRAFSVYDGNNLDSIVASMPQRVSSIGDGIITRRRELADAILAVERELKCIGPECRTGYDPACDTIDVWIDDISRFNKAGCITADELKKAKWCFIDIEVPLFKKKDNTISWVAVDYCENGVEKKEVHTLYDFAEEFEGAKVYSYKTQEELVEGIKNSVLRENPYVVSTYNTKFDLIKLRQAGDMGVGERGTNPIHKVTLPFFEKIGIRGREVIDFWHWSRTHFKYLPNQKLVTVAKHLLGDDAFEKSISYDEMEALEIRAKEGDKEAMRKIAHYVLEDVTILPKILQTKELQDSLDDAEFMLRAYGIPVANFFHSANSPKIPLDRKFFLDVGSFRDIVFNPASQKSREQYARQKFSKFVASLFKAGSKPGLYRNLVKAYVPAADYLRRFIYYKVPDARKFFDEHKYKPELIDNPQRQFFLSRYANGFAVNLITDIMLHTIEDNEMNRMLRRLKLPYWEFYHFDSRYRKHLKASSDWGYVHLRNKRLSLAAFSRHIDEDVREWLEKKNLEDEDFYNLVNKRTSLSKKWGKVGYVYGDEKEMIEAELFGKIWDIEEILSKNGCKIVHKDGRWLYLDVPEGVDLVKQGVARKVIPVDRIPTAFVTEDFNNPKSGKIFYRRHGFNQGFNEGDNPTFNYNLLEKNVLGAFQKYLVEGSCASALEELHNGMRRFRDRNIESRELLWISNKGKHKAFENGEKIIFYNWKIEDLPLDEESGKHFYRKMISKDEYKCLIEKDEPSGRQYFMEPFKRWRVNRQTGKREKCIEYKKRYMMSPDCVMPDMTMYSERFRKIAEKMLAPLIGGDAAFFFEIDYKTEDFKELAERIQFAN